MEKLAGLGYHLVECHNSAKPCELGLWPPRSTKIDITRQVTGYGRFWHPTDLQVRFVPVAGVPVEVVGVLPGLVQPRASHTG